MEIGQVEKSFPLAEPCIRFLQHHDIGVEREDDLLDALRVKSSIGPDAFVDVVGCEIESASRCRRVSVG
jgi:hypothetical protein